MLACDMRGSRWSASTAGGSTLSWLPASTSKTGGPACGERLGDLASHRVPNEDVVGVSHGGDDRLYIVGEASHVVGSGRVRGLAPAALVVVHESLVGV